MAEIQRVTEDVRNVKNEVEGTKQQLEKIKGEGSVWSEAGRQAIVEKCLAVIKPKLEGSLPKFTKIAENLRSLGQSPEAQSVRREFQQVLESITDALRSMARYGKPEDRAVADGLCAKVDACKNGVA